jgi:(2Fe-2S) ferredoxin
VILLSRGGYSKLPRQQLARMVATVEATQRYGLVLSALIDQGKPSPPDALTTCTAMGMKDVVVQPVFVPGDANLEHWLVKVIRRWQARQDTPVSVVLGASFGSHLVLDNTLLHVLEHANDATDVGEHPPRNWEHDPDGWSVLPEHEYHVLTCRGPHCTAHGANTCWDSLAHSLTDYERRGGKARVLVAQTGCLYRCNRGPILIVYPDGVWYGGITPANVGRIVDEHLAGGRVVDELRIAPGKFDDSADDVL